MGLSRDCPGGFRVFSFVPVLAFFGGVVMVSLLDSLQLALWVFSPVIALGGAWAIVALVRRWLAVKRVRRYQAQRLDQLIGRETISK